MSELPGRSCPIRYHYGASSLASLTTKPAQVLYVIGGLYGNLPALRTIEAMIATEVKAGLQVSACFNGDFNWFNVSDEDFLAINATVSKYDAICGNVEAELALDDMAEGCGCAYPENVSDDVVERSNRIFETLHATALRHPETRQWLSTLPMIARYRIGQHNIGIVHGDYEALAGWKFDVSALNAAQTDATLMQAFEAAQVEVFASTHTCLPILKTFSDGMAKAERAIINNGSAGMPNFKATQYGLITRLSTHPSPHGCLYGTSLGDLRIEALQVPYEQGDWLQRFASMWPKGSDAWESYHARISAGPDFSTEQAFAPESASRPVLGPMSR